MVILTGKKHRRLISREWAIALLVAAVLGFLGFVAGIRWLETRMTFHPTRTMFRERPSAAKDVWLTTRDGVRLHGWLFENGGPAPKTTIIFFHGNGGNISHVGWVGERLSARGFDVLLIDYRGYGESDGHARDETDLNADGDAALAYVVETRKVPAARVVLYGQSLGTTVAADLASRQECGALILESGLSSASAMASASLPWLPSWLHIVGKNRFASAAKLAKVRAPVLITHGDPDSVIPTAEGRALFAGANEPKQLIIFPGAGHNVFGSVGERYLDVLTEFINRATSPQTTTAR
jgi:pimeloyl-ACP methyl ester carboxylesterase